MPDWFVYILRCADETFYTGITTDIARRVREHNAGNLGARYTRARRPVELVHCEKLPGRAEATKREMEIRRLGKNGKEKLVAEVGKIDHAID